ncbi:tRNA/rRNA methyltransferase [Bacteroidota bacterium]
MDVYFILVEPAVPGNVGASARAIKTMGFKQLRLVNPCDHLSTEARMLAHASVEILEKAKVYSSLEEALEDIDLSVATTAKKRDARVEFHLNTAIPEIIESKGGSVKRVGIVFGGEESGLSNEQIRMCDIASSIPLKQTYPSLNLSQAVMIYAYTLADLSVIEESGRVSPEREKKFSAMMDKSKDMLVKLGVDRSPALYNRILERLALLGEEDIHILLSVLGRMK